MYCLQELSYRAQFTSLKPAFHLQPLRIKPEHASCCHAYFGCLAIAAAAAAVSGKDAAEGAAAVFQDMASQSGLVLQPIPVVDGQLDL